MHTGEEPPFLPAHDFSVFSLLVVESNEVQPAVNQVKGKFLRELKLAVCGLLDRLIHGDANFPSHTLDRISGESDDVGGAKVLQKISMNSGMARPV